MRWQIFCFLVFFILASCTPKQPPAETPQQCKLFEIPSEGGCCRDLNENGICDTKDFAQNISAAERAEYEAAAERARAKAEESGRLRRTIANELADNASAITSYRFVYAGDEIVIANGSIVRKLIRDYPAGDTVVNGRKIKAVVNTVALDYANRKATAQCVPPAALVLLASGTQCDEIAGRTFDVPFDAFALKLPDAWLRDFLNRTPYETLTGNHVGKLTATLYRFTDLKDAQHKTSIWVDDSTSIPIRIEVWQGNALVQKEEYLDLYRI